MSSITGVFLSAEAVGKRLSFYSLTLAVSSYLLLTSSLTLLLTMLPLVFCTPQRIRLFCHYAQPVPSLSAISRSSLLQPVMLNNNDNNKSITTVFLLRGSYNSFHLLSIFKCFFLPQRCAHVRFIQRVHPQLLRRPLRIFKPSGFIQTGRPSPGWLLKQ